MINFENIVVGFRAYLESLQESGEKDYDLDSFSDVSIFMYSDEFKDYVTDQLDLDSQLESIDLSELFSMDFSNNQFTIPDEEQTDNPAEDQDAGQQNFFTGLLNSLFKNDLVKNLLDTDKNSEISEEELKAFLNVLGGLDGSNLSLSLEDIFSGIDSIKNNDFTIPSTETPTVEAPEETPPDSSPFDGNYEYTYDPPKNDGQDGPQEIDLTKLSVDELNTLLSETQTEYLQPQEEYLASILDESETELAGLKTASEELLATYEEKLKEVNVEMAEQLVDIEERLDAKKEEIEQNDQAIFEQENTINDCQTNYDNAVSRTANLKSSYDALVGMDTSEMSDEDKSALQAKIDAAKEAYDQAVIDEEAAKTALDEAKEALTPLQEKAETLNGELTAIEEEKTAFEAQISEEYPEIAEYMDAYNEKKQEYYQYKTDASSYMREQIQVSKAYMNEIKTAITNAQNKKDTEEYSFTVKNPDDPSSMYNAEAGEHLVDSAYAMLDQYGSSSGYCARGVSRTMFLAYGIEMGGHGYQWDSNMEQLVEQGLFVEVTGDYPTSADLTTLPAGAVVCWENTSNSGDGGKRYGHVCIADGKGGEISDHYQANIYQSVGGRSDQYRIFIPV